MTGDRFASITGLLEARPEQRTATVHQINTDAAKPAAVPGSPPEPDETAPPSRSVRPSRQPKSRESSGGNRRVVFKIAPELHSRLLTRAKAAGASHGNIVLDAVEAAYVNKMLSELVASEKRPAEGKHAGMFARTAIRQPAATTVTVEIQLRAQAVEQLDQLVKESTADNRTQLITAALRHHLA